MSESYFGRGTRQAIRKIEIDRLYNEAVALVLEARLLIEDIRVIGPGQHNRLSDAQDRLMEALEKIGEIAPNTLSATRRAAIARLQ